MRAKHAARQLRRLAVCSLAALSLLPIGGVFAHAEHDVVRFVAAHGDDSGLCKQASQPCRTITYAARQAGKGDRVLVARGRYELHSAEDIFYVTSSTVPAYGGYDSADGYAEQAPARHPTILIGADPEFREQLTSRGFQLIADRKRLSADVAKQSAELQQMLTTLRSAAGSAPCANGDADGFSCRNIDLLSHLPISDFSSRPGGANDVWGFVDLNTNNEYAIVGLDNGTAVVDVTDPASPREIGTIPGPGAIWRDIKVYQFFDNSAGRWQAYAYVTVDGVASGGLSIIDLTDLPNNVSLANNSAVTRSTHNIYISNVDYSTGIAINGLTPLIQLAGARLAGTDLDGGRFRTLNLADPLNPRLVAVRPTAGYMHDATSLVIDDARAAQCRNADENCEVLVDFNETTFEFWDSTSAANPEQLSSSSYSQASYVHSGWWSEDKRFIFVHDEIDEQRHSLTTTLRVFGIDNLTQPVHVGTWSGSTPAIDHNGFVRGNRYYMSNYTRGLTVLDITDAANPVEVGHFDTFPLSDSTSFNGAWGVYPFLPSGTVLVSDIASGLYMLADKTLDAPQGQLAFTASICGADEGTTLNIAVARLDGDETAVTVNYETLEGSADTEDFIPSNGSLSWAAGENGLKTITIDLTADTEAEDTELLLVRLFNPRNGATLGQPNLARILTSGGVAGAQVGLDSGSINIDETANQVRLIVKRICDVSTPMTVDYRTEPDTATAGSDFTSLAAGQLTWAADDTSSRVIEIEILDDDAEEGNEQFRVVLSNAVGATLGAGSTSNVTIVDDETVIVNDNPVAPGDPATPAPDGGGGGGGGGLFSSLLMLLLAIIRSIQIPFANKQ